MSLNRYSAKRDQNEASIVKALRKFRHVTLLSGKGVPDLLVLRPARELPIFVCETIEQALDAAMAEDFCLLEIKMPGKKLTEAQRIWHRVVLLGE